MQIMLVSSRLRKLLMGIVSVFLLLFIFVQSVAAKDEMAVTAEEVIRYQEVFFHFYRKDEYQALVNLTAGLKDKKIIENKFANELLLGNLYLMYGLPYLAEKSLKFVAANSPSKNQTVLARFYLSKQYFENGKYVKFLSLSSKVGDALPKSLRTEKKYMLGMTLINQSRLSQAEIILEDMAPDTDWYNFFKFNLGASYLKNGNTEKGESLLKDVARSRFSSEVMLSLKDKSNIVLGYYYIRSEDSKSAITMLENVRLDGAFSNKALLGLGWAYSQQNKFRDALVPWLALSEKNPLDVTVQEAKLASAFAFRELGAEKRALELYKDSIDNYEDVKKQFHKVMSASFSKSVFSPLLKSKRTDDYGVTLGIQEQLANKNGSVLVDLLKQEAFQKMFNDYRDLKQLQNQLSNWREDLDRMTIVMSLKTGDQQPVAKGVNRLTSYKGLNNKELILTLKDTVQLQSDRMEILLGMYEEKIRDEFVRAINLKQQYLIAYLSQSRFALAQILDRAQQSESHD